MQRVTRDTCVNGVGMRCVWNAGQRLLVKRCCSTQPSYCAVQGFVAWLIDGKWMWYACGMIHAGVLCCCRFCRCCCAAMRSTHVHNTQPIGKYTSRPRTHGCSSVVVCKESEVLLLRGNDGGWLEGWDCSLQQGGGGRRISCFTLTTMPSLHLKDTTRAQALQRGSQGWPVKTSHEPCQTGRTVACTGGTWP